MRKLLFVFGLFLSAQVFAQTPVTPIRGQSGVDGGSGASSSATQRVILSTDDPLVSKYTATAAADSSRLPVSLPDGVTTTGTCTSACGATNLVALSTTGYMTATVHMTSVGSGNTVQYQVSNDTTNGTDGTWQATSCLVGGAVGSSPPETSTALAATRFVVCPAVGKWFRVNVQTYGSGTLTAVVTLKQTTINSFGALLGATVSGPVAHGVAVSGGPVRVAGRARTSNYTALSNDNTADLVTTVSGALITRPYSIPEGEWSYAAASGGISNTTTAVTIAAAAGSGLRNYIKGCQLSSDALGAATELAIRDGASGTVIWRTKIGTAGITGGEQVTFENPLKSTANTLLEVVTLTATVTGGVFVNCQGYIAP